ncbi:MAG: SAM-dependent methyltransferase [Clostridia bacterium]|nr:SAM-dependent methyltransferase [Clostridia bacterium]
MQQMTHAPALDARLRTAFDFVRPGAIVADIGTDHAYLPAALILEGRALSAIAADVNAGPLVHAAETVKKYGLTDRVQLRETDGLHGLEEEGLTDILIFGMGGELIVRILNEAPFTRNSAIRLILQPMTKCAELRRWLTANGFSICGEQMSQAAGKIYQTICAEYSAKPTALSPLEEEFGPCNLAAGSDLLHARMSHWLDVLNARLDGRSRAGLSGGDDEKMRDEILAWRSTHGGNAT